MKIAFSFFLLIYSRCGAPASWAVRHIIVCLDNELDKHISVIFLGLVRLCEQNVLRTFTAADHKKPSLKSSSVSINKIH